MKDFAFSTAEELATAIRERRVSAVELVEAFLSRIKRHNPALNAIVTLDEEGARARAREADAAIARGLLWGPLHGVPITIKDTIATAGLRTTAGFPPLANYIPPADATVVARLRKSGAILLGKTNTPPLAEDFQTTNPIFGRSNNPWDLDRTPGGSTGGGAAAVAAGLTALEIGTDIGGSVRHPAHYCGVYSLKPTEHRVPLTGNIPELPGAPRGIRHMGTIGVLARSVSDLRLALSLIAGPDGYDWEVPPVPLVAQPLPTPARVHLAWTDTFGGIPITSDTARSLERFVADLEGLGYLVERASPEGLDFTAVWETFGELVGAEVGSTFPPERETERASKFGDASEVPSARGMARRVHATMRQYTETLTRRDGLIAAIEGFLQVYDAWICPVSVGPAFPHCPTGTPIPVDSQTVPYWIAGTAHCNPFNLTGNPAVVLPVRESAEGLPIGVQIIGRRWGEMELLALAEHISEALDLFRPPPGY